MTLDSYLRLKRIFDLTLIIAAIPLVVPVMALVALAIRLDGPGPILFTQPRTGRDGLRFNMLKFRTMVPNAAELEEQLRPLSILPWPAFKIVDDPRITRVGKVLRKTSLDELPQLINVLRGEMSLVGPRPTPWPLSDYELWQTSRLTVPPGITGRWQVEGRNTSDFSGWLRFEMAYIRRLSLWQDIVLLGRTVGAVVRGTGE